MFGADVHHHHAQGVASAVQPLETAISQRMNAHLNPHVDIGDHDDDDDDDHHHHRHETHDEILTDRHRHDDDHPDARPDSGQRQDSASVSLHQPATPLDAEPRRASDGPTQSTQVGCIVVFSASSAQEHMTLADSQQRDPPTSWSPKSIVETVVLARVQERGQDDSTMGGETETGRDGISMGGADCSVG
eukprot:2280640-Rhodomonas_salina.1